MKRVFVSDCEGPISKNDNAFEATRYFVPNGARLFSVISKYDDVLADIVKRPDYNAGDTLKLILPFLKAYDVTDNSLSEFSAENLFLIQGSRTMLEYVNNLFSSYIVSTSYEHYIRALCQAMGFPFENTYCTHLTLDNYQVSAQEKLQLKDLAQEIAAKPIIEIPPNAESVDDFSKKDQETVKRLDEIFWNEIRSMGSWAFLENVKPVGGCQKAEAVKDITKKCNVQLSDVMYVGDSITDVEAFKLIKESEGLAISFNGNQYAIKNTEIAILAEDNTVLAALAELWGKFDREEIFRLLKRWSYESLERSSLNTSILERLSRVHSIRLPDLQIVTHSNMEILIRESTQFRKRVRGEAVGRLG